MISYVTPELGPYLYRSQPEQQLAALHLYICVVDGYATCEATDCFSRRQPLGDTTLQPGSFATLCPRVVPDFYPFLGLPTSV